MVWLLPLVVTQTLMTGFPEWDVMRWLCSLRLDDPGTSGIPPSARLGRQNRPSLSLFWQFSTRPILKFLDWQKTKKSWYHSLKAVYNSEKGPGSWNMENGSARWLSRASAIEDETTAWLGRVLARLTNRVWRVHRAGTDGRARVVAGRVDRVGVPVSKALLRGSVMTKRPRKISKHRVRLYGSSQDMCSSKVDTKRESDAKRAAAGCEAGPEVVWGWAVHYHRGGSGVRVMYAAGGWQPTIVMFNGTDLSTDFGTTVQMEPEEPQYRLEYFITDLVPAAEHEEPVNELEYAVKYEPGTFVPQELVFNGTIAPQVLIDSRSCFHETEQGSYENAWATENSRNSAAQYFLAFKIEPQK
ncbi:hypothetical protein DFH08DRAFT_946293 [Mycena albidolilacea]|uniref:Uncharacterized protein n=1 Tax=Mycena albidolilacea TaxID=1033008 RepID=A0AAD6YWV4_9AGAR|nr:hypothetical protein DFH08DRAFT_946293 [Mycena albidolilacea]